MPDKFSAMKPLCSLLIILATAPVGFTQSEPALPGTVQRFAKAWQRRDHKAVENLLAPDATFFDINGGDPGTIKSALGSIRRRMRGVTTKETLIDRSYSRTGNTCVVSDIARVDHKRGERRYGGGVRRSMVWVRQAEKTWKLAHLHQSAYSNFADSIASFEAADRKQPPKPGGVVFVGSSSIRMWRTLKTDFPNTYVVHRGFGGSQMVDCIMYVDKLVTRHKPRKVVIYEGDNDIGAGKSAERVLKDFRTFVQLVHDRSPMTKIGFVAIKPSRARWKLWPEMAKANKLIAEACGLDDRVQFLDIATPMLDPRGEQPAADWFIADGLHMTPKGYATWTKVVRPWIAEE